MQLSAGNGVYWMSTSLPNTICTSNVFRLSSLTCSIWRWIAVFSFSDVCGFPLQAFALKYLHRETHKWITAIPHLIDQVDGVTLKTIDTDFPQ